MKKSIISSAILITLLAISSVGEAGKYNNYTVNGFKVKFSTALQALQRKFGRDGLKAMPQRIAPKSITKATASKYIANEIHRRAGEKLGDFRVLRSKLQLNNNSIKLSEGNKQSIGFEVKIKVAGSIGTHTVKGWLRTDESGAISVVDRVVLTKIPTIGSTPIGLTKK